MNLRPAARPPLMPKLTIEPAPLRQQPPGQADDPGGFERGMQHPVDRLVGVQEIEHGSGVVHVALHAHGKRLDALQQLERIRRRQAGAEIAQALGAGAHDEGRRAELLVEEMP